jgi:hypothetical protein
LAAGWAGTAVAVLGIVFSFAGGYVIAHLYGSPSDEALYEHPRKRLSIEKEKEHGHEDEKTQAHG